MLKPSKQSTQKLPPPTTAAQAPLTWNLLSFLNAPAHDLGVVADDRQVTPSSLKFIQRVQQRRV
jgi:hypothetical protein